MEEPGLEQTSPLLIWFMVPPTAAFLLRALSSLFQRLSTGYWPDLVPDSLDGLPGLRVLGEALVTLSPPTMQGSGRAPQMPTGPIFYHA